MSHSDTADKAAIERGRKGFSLLELIVVLGILTTVSGIIMTVMFRMAATQGTVANRTEMHSSIRSATELLQQEIGQAGRVATPSPLAAPATLAAAVLGNGASQSPTVSSSSGLFPGEVVVVGPDSAVACPGASPTYCASQENITLTAVGTGSITGVWQDPHASGAPVSVRGTFASGVVPPTGSAILYATSAGVSTKLTLTAGSSPGSSATVLKMFGDINGDGNMVYVEYACNQGTQAAPGTFTRTVIPFDTASAKSTFTPQVLLNNILYNNPPTFTPGGPPCFAYQTRVVGNDTYVVDVAVTLTVQTQIKDPQTGQYQTETKALLNISPRNVYEGWQIASLPGGMQARIQPMPQTIVNLLNP